MIFILDCLIFKFQWSNGRYNEKIYLAIRLFDIINCWSKLEFFALLRKIWFFVTL